MKTNIARPARNSFQTSAGKVTTVSSSSRRRTTSGIDASSGPVPRGRGVRTLTGAVLATGTACPSPVSPDVSPTTVAIAQRPPVNPSLRTRQKCMTIRMNPMRGRATTCNT
jgi:hypothetical protein